MSNEWSVTGAQVNSKAIQWFPGHMMKTLRLIEKHVKSVDIVIKLLDARIPYSSTNPEIESYTANKKSLVILNKADLADQNATAKWLSFYKSNGIEGIAIQSKDNNIKEAVKKALDKSLAELIAHRKAKGIVNVSITAMVVGIPNVGKSTFINSIVGAARAKAADKPGVTRGVQHISVPGLDLLDMPGVLWKKFDSVTIASNLAFIGSIKDDILNLEDIAISLLEQIKQEYFQRLIDRYKLLQQDKECTGYELLQKIATKRGMLMLGGEPDTERAAIKLLDEFRGSKLGRFTLEANPRKHIV